MFGFGKKKLTDKLVFQISMMVSMFDSWSIDNGFGGLEEDARLMVIQKLLKMEGMTGSMDEITSITMGMLAINPDYDLDFLRNERAKRQFDPYVVSFCESIQLPKSLYSN
jgi:hypothetical protein